MQIPFLNRRDSEDEWALGLLVSLAETGSKCVITTRSRTGEPHVRKVRVSNYAFDDMPTLLFVIPRDAEIAADLMRDASLTLSVRDPRTGSVMHMEGTGTLYVGEHTPAYLHPSVRHQPNLQVVAGQVDFMLLRVEIPMVDGHMAESQPVDIDLSVVPPLRGTPSFLRGLLS